MTPEEYVAHREGVLQITQHPLGEDVEDEKPLADSCSTCNTILPTDTSAWNGECPRCRTFVEVSTR